MCINEAFLGLLADRANRLPKAAAAVERALAARIEVEAARVVAVARAERAGPAVAVRARVVEAAIVVVACGGQEDRVTIRPLYHVTINAILCNPRPCAFL